MGLTQITGNGLSENINIDSNTLKVDGTNNRVGIGTGSPTSKLTVAETGYSAVEIRSNRTSAADNIGGVHFRTVSTDVAYIQSLVDGTLKFRNTSALTERLRIDTSGRLGIGTSSPSAQIHLNQSGTGSYSTLRLSNSGASGRTYEIGVGGSTSGSGYAGNLYFYDSTASALRAVIDSSGQVGIGVTSAAQQLHVSDSTNYQGILVNGNAAPSICFDNAANTAVKWRVGLSGVNVNNFCISQAGNTDKFIIDSSGNVGIGVSSLSSSSRLTLLESAGNAQTLEIKGANSGGVGSQPGIKFTASSGDNIGGIFGDTNTDAVILQTGGSERMRIDSSGLVGIGNTAMGSLTGNAANNLVVGPGNANAGMTVYTGTGNYGSLSFADGTSGDAAYRGSVLYHHNGDSMRFFTAAGERMRIDSSGRVGIGISDPDAYYQHGRALVVGATGANSGITIRAGTASQCIIAFADGTTGGSQQYAGYVIYDHNIDGMLFATGALERMRITSGGNVLFNCTSLPNASTDGFLITGTSSGNRSSSGTSTTAYNHFLFYNGNGIVGGISTSGSTTTYSTSSDYRLKENVIALDGAITRIKQLQPRRFNFIADPGTTVDGFVAHEAQTVVPEAVTGTHNEVDDDGNAVMQGIDQSKLVPLLTAALQEAIAKIETLETKVAALEAAE